uniref:Uncharacterized protein n=2 Tax=Aegilops tauschii subsp. strangulata TaxID=200361 RepID=A0A453GJG4_AEGTS
MTSLALVPLAYGLERKLYVNKAIRFSSCSWSVVEAESKLRKAYEQQGKYNLDKHRKKWWKIYRLKRERKETSINFEGCLAVLPGMILASSTSVSGCLREI